ncbi:LysR family transcriptional regulator [Agrococcus sp. 1P02AA]|uniref:LysR family transcriptional regulator n=1 Tax=Agrococcus sp. 1P02AA TaxID=3132259 RepID=UPI0039A67628
MDTRKLECFLALAEELHFGRVAERLHLGQATVSEAIRALERDVGEPLFERTSRRVALTPGGERLRDELETPLAAVLEALAGAQRRARGVPDVLRIGYLGGGLYEYQRPVVADFERRVPGVDLQFVELTYSNQISAIRAAEVDASIVRAPIGAGDLLRGAILMRDHRMLVVPSGHRLAHRKLVDPEELEGESMIQLPPGTMTEDWLAFHLPLVTPGGRQLAPGPVVATIREGLGAVARGQAVMTISQRAQQYFSHPGTAFVEIDLPPTETALVKRRGDQRRVLDELERAARKTAARYGSLVEQRELWVPA